MRRAAICVFAVMAAGAASSVALGAGGGEEPVVVRAGNVIVTVNGNATPPALPRHRLAPISFHASAAIATADGSHPPALTEVVLDTGKAGAIEADDFPSCRKNQLEATTTVEAERKCGDAIVGRGRTVGEIAFPESAPFDARGPLVLFNGGRHGKEFRLYIHAYVPVPAPTAIVVPVVTTKIHRGPYRLHAVSRIPPVAGGAGSVTYFRLNINRPGYLMANCDNGHFSAYVHAGFAEGTAVEGSFERPCRPID
jgi:hypothetical protein